MIGRTSRWIAALTGGVLLAGCGAATPAEQSGTASGSITVVASTNVWASVAAAVGGSAVSVSSVLSDPSADPHSFEASPKVKLEMSNASLVIVNGGGYDDWATDTAESLDPQPRTLNAVQASGLDTSGDFNEHIFYNLDAVATVAQAIAVQLGEADPGDQKTFTDNAAAFVEQLAALKKDVVAAGAAHPGTKVVATEPVPGYLIASLGFTDVTPASFSEAVEADAEVSVRDLDTVKQLLVSKTASLLFDNTQTGGPVTDQLIAAAQSAGVGVVGVTETLPADAPGYVTWMSANLAAVVAALG